MATLGLVAPKDWLSRTKLRLARGRSAKLLMIDKAYAKYYIVRSDQNKKELHQHLTDYLIEKGRHWENVRRNKQSGGLMKYVHEHTRSEPVKKNVLIKRIPEARHGLVYLWQKADVKTQWATIALEGALSVGSSTASMLQASNYSKGESLQHLGVVKEGSRVDTAIKYGQHAKTIAGAAGKLPSAEGKGIQNQPMTPPPPPEKRRPVIKLAALSSDPSAIELAKHYFGSAFNYVYEAIRKAVMDIFNDLKLKYQTGDLMGTLGGGVASLINFILGKVAKHAAPIAGNVIEIAQGIAKTIRASKDRLIAYMRRNEFVISPGHPMLIGNAIEKQMNWAIANGAYSMAKGGAKLGGNIASWGASALIDVIAACVEFAWKFLSRLYEGHSMRNWIADVKYLTGNRNNWKADPKDNIWRPAIVYDDKAFIELVERGCKTSPCVPMMTLNSGISGDQMMFMKMFDDTGGILGQGSGISSSGSKPTESAQAQFDAATKYWTHLKQWGRSYLAGTGFTFTSEDKVVKGLMWHAIAHHKSGSMSVGDKVLNFVAG